MVGNLIGLIQIHILECETFFYILLRYLNRIHLYHLRCPTMSFEFVHDFIVIKGRSFLVLRIDEVLVPMVIRGNSKI